jgi:hypothetical protein
MMEQSVMYSGNAMATYDFVVRLISRRRPIDSPVFDALL